MADVTSKLNITNSLGVQLQDSKGKDLVLYDYDYNGNYMAERKITATMQSLYDIDFVIGSKVLFRGQNYYIQTQPIANRIFSSEMISYTIVFWSVEYELGLVSFQDVVSGDVTAYNRTGNLDVFLNGTVEQLMDWIVANMERVYTTGDLWQYDLNSAVDNTIVKQITLTNVYCSDALLLVKSLFGLEYIIENLRYIRVGYPPTIGDTVFEFGKDKGLCEINRLQNDAKIITRAVGYGSERNIPENYRSDKYSTRLMLPVATGGYIEDTDSVALYGIREGIYPANDLIYPSITGSGFDSVVSVDAFVDTDHTETVVITAAWQEKILLTDIPNDPLPHLDYQIINHPAVTKQITVTASTTVVIYVLDPGFSVFDTDILSPTPPSMSFTTGQMQGAEFKILSMEKHLTDGIKWIDGLYKITLERNADDPAHIIPNSTANIVASDKFVYLNIYMDQSYVDQAELALEADMRTWLATQIASPQGYSIKVSEEHLKRNTGIEAYIYDGYAVRIKDTKLGIPTEIDTLIQSLTISYKANQLLPTYDLTVSPTPLKNVIAKIQLQLKGASMSNNIQNIQITNKVQNTLKSAYTLERHITTVERDLRGEIIAPQSIQNNSLSIDVRNTNYILHATLQVNYLGDVNSAYGSAGILIHKDADIVWGGVYDVDHQIWTIASPQTFTLDAYVTYYMYIKCDLEDGSAIWVASTTQIGTLEIDGYYMFEWGQILQIESDKRWIQSPNGVSGISSYVYLGYASDDTGTDFTLTDDGLLQYMAIISVVSPLLPPVVGNFTGKWFKRIPDTDNNIIETPSGEINGINTIFATSYPYKSGSIMVFVNGLKEYYFTQTSDTTVTLGNAPKNIGLTDIIEVKYTKK